MKQRLMDQLQDYRYALAKIRQPLTLYDRSEADNSKQTFFSGSCRVDIKVDERCKTCATQTCYRARIRTVEYDWRSKRHIPRALKLRHLHLSPHNAQRWAIDSTEALREIARAAFAFGSYWDKEYGREHGVSQDSAQAVSDAMDRTESGDPLLNDERFDSFTSLGSYPITYVSSDGEVYCGKCAPRYCRKENGEPFYEGSPETCADCQEEIESAYGDPDSKDNDESNA